MLKEKGARKESRGDVRGRREREEMEKSEEGRRKRRGKGETKGGEGKGRGKVLCASRNLIDWQLERCSYTVIFDKGLITNT